MLTKDSASEKCQARYHGMFSLWTGADFLRAFSQKYHSENTVDSQHNVTRGILI